MQPCRSTAQSFSHGHDPAELNRIGFRLYEKFRPEVPAGNEGWGANAVLEIEKILAVS